MAQHVGPQGKCQVRSGRCRSEGKTTARGFFRVSTGKAKQHGVKSEGMASLSNSGRLWGRGAVLSRLVPGLGLL